MCVLVCTDTCDSQQNTLFVSGYFAHPLSRVTLRRDLCCGWALATWGVGYANMQIKLRLASVLKSLLISSFMPFPTVDNVLHANWCLYIYILLFLQFKHREHLEEPILHTKLLSRELEGRVLQKDIKDQPVPVSFWFLNLFQSHPQLTTDCCFRTWRTHPAQASREV